MNTLDEKEGVPKIIPPRSRGGINSVTPEQGFAAVAKNSPGKELTEQAKESQEAQKSRNYFVRLDNTTTSIV